MSGNWADGTKWSTDPIVPSNGTPAGTTYEVALTAAGAAHAVTLDTDVTLDSLLINSPDATLLHTAGTLDILQTLDLQSGAYELLGGTLSGGTVTAAGGQQFTAVGGTLSGVVMNTDFHVGGQNLQVFVENDSVLSGRRITIGDSAGAGTLYLRGTQTLDSGVEILFQDSPTDSILRNENQPLTISADSVVRTSGGNGQLGWGRLSGPRNVNHGLISSRTPGKILYVDQFHNHGIIEAMDGGTVVLGESVNEAGGSILIGPGSRLVIFSFENKGTVTANDATIDLRNFSTSKLGNIVRTGGAVNVKGLVSNGGATIALSNDNPSWTLMPGGEIAGGLITAADGQLLNATGGSLRSVWLAAPVNVAAGASVGIQLVNFQPGSRITLQGTPSGAATTLKMLSSTYSGAPTITFDNGLSMLDQGPIGSGNETTLGPGSVIRTGTGSGSIGPSGVMLQAGSLISAQTPGQSITIQGSVTNDGTIEAINGASVAIESGLMTTTGIIRADADSSITISGIASVRSGTLGGVGTIHVGGDAWVGDTFGSLVTTGPGVLNVNKLSVSGKLDLTTGKMVVRGAAGTGDWNTVSYRGLTGMIASGRGPTGAWDGLGLVTSDSRAVNSDDFMTLGIATAAQAMGVAPTETTTWAGQTVNGSAVLIAFTYAGDANLDGQINIDDYGRIDANVSQSGSVFGYANGDFNYDGSINIDDYGIIDGNITRQSAPLPNWTAPAAERLESVAAVPEPGSLALLLFAPLLLPRRRRAVTAR